MNDANFVRGLQRRRDLAADRQRFIERQPAASQPRREVFAFDKLMTSTVRASASRAIP